jgi:hypothetical protein
VAQPLNSLAAATQQGGPSFAVFAKGGNWECMRKFVDPCRVVTNQVAHAASPLTLAKKRK